MVTRFAHDQDFILFSLKLVGNLRMLKKSQEKTLDLIDMTGIRTRDFLGPTLYHCTSVTPAWHFPEIEWSEFYFIYKNLIKYF